MYGKSFGGGKDAALLYPVFLRQKPPDHATLQRAELDERSAMSASESEVEAARLLSDVMDARRRLEEDADREVSVEVMPTATEMPTAKERPKTKEMPTAKERSSATDSAGAGLKERLEDARAITAVRRVMRASRR